MDDLEFTAVLNFLRDLCGLRQILNEVSIDKESK
jgi:hypothetical protein